MMIDSIHLSVNVKRIFSLGKEEEEEEIAVALSRFPLVALGRLVARLICISMSDNWAEQGSSGRC